ncbi:MAG TPA: four helix bundle protein [Patescibacteria group bacterium]|nr:four helix bundle protein [Patescibacteria group bacterium]
MQEKNYVALKDLIIYRLSIDLCNYCWDIYISFDWDTKKIEGHQFIRSIDSIGANIAEGYGRFHFLDRIKFYYNARGSLLESKHWVLLLKNRNKISVDDFDILISKLNKLNYQLNLYIASCHETRDNI